jgi:hypothetical protein
MALPTQTPCRWLPLATMLWCVFCGTLPALASQTQITGSSLLGLGDVSDVPALVARLQSDSHPSTKALSRYIWGEFDPATKELLGNPDSSLTQRQTGLIQELNKIIQGSSLYEATRFARVALRPETRSLTAKTPVGEYLLLLNRLLLEDAYSAEIARDNISYLGSSLVDDKEGMYRHDVIVRRDQSDAVAVSWQDHASELRSFSAYKSDLVALGAVGTSSESISILNLANKTLSAFILCREPFLSPDGRYISYLQFVPRHMVSDDGRIPDIVLVFDLDAATNDALGIEKDEGWVVVAANIGVVVYPPDFFGHRVFPLPRQEGMQEIARARKWAADNRRLFVVVQQDARMQVVQKNMANLGDDSLKRREIDLGKVLDHATGPAITRLSIRELEMPDDNTLVILFAPSPSVGSDRLTINLN